MGKGIKILIVIAVVAAVGILILVKESDRGSGIEATVIPSRALEKLSSSRLPRLVDLGADKCIPCKMMAPILEELRTEYAGVFEVVFIDVWKTPSAGKEFGIKIIPTQIFFDASGKELYRHQGFISKEDIIARWKVLGVRLKETVDNETK